MNLNGTSAAAGILLVASMGCQCNPLPQDSAEGGNEIVFVLDEEEYQEKLASFNLSPEDAAKRAASFGQDLTESPIAALGTMYLIIGDDFVFSNPSKDGISLTGVYVNGLTGHARLVNEQIVLKWESHADWRSHLKNASRKRRQRLHPLHN